MNKKNKKPLQQAAMSKPVHEKTLPGLLHVVKDSISSAQTCLSFMDSVYVEASRYSSPATVTYVREDLLPSPHAGDVRQVERLTDEVTMLKAKLAGQSASLLDIQKYIITTTSHIASFWTVLLFVGVFGSYLISFTGDYYCLAELLFTILILVVAFLFYVREIRKLIRRLKI